MKIKIEDLEAAIVPIEVDGSKKAICKINDEQKDEDPDVWVKSEDDLKVVSSVSWSSDEVLKIEAENDIIIGKDVKIQHTGSSGGLILSSTKGTIIFEEGSSVDFTKSTGSISFFYNPEVPQVGNKYANPKNFDDNVLVNEQVYFKAFMLVHDINDVCKMKKQKVGDFSLSNKVKVSWQKESTQPSASEAQFQDFVGTLTFNGGSFEKGVGYSYSSFPCPELFLFYENEAPIYSHNFLQVAPPLYGKYRSFYQSIVRCQQKHTLSDNQISFAEMVCVRGADLKTPLHLAAELGQTDVINTIASYFKCVPPQVKMSFFQRTDACGRTALELAVSNAHVDTVKALARLYKHCLKYCKPQTLFSSMSILSQEFKFKEVIEAVKEIEANDKVIKNNWTVAPSKERCEEMEYQSAVEAQRIFLAKVNFQMSIDKNDPVNLFDLNDLPSRSRIMVMMKVGDILDLNSVKYSYGGLEHTFIRNKTQNQPGNFYYKELGNYTDIGEQIEKLSKKVPLKKICELIKNSRLSGEPIKEVELGHDDPLTLNTDPSTLNTDCEFLNRFMILLDFEVARRLSIGDVHYNLPVAVGLACMLRIINDSEEDQAMTFLKSGIEMFSGSIEERQAALKKLIEVRFENLKLSADRAKIQPGNPSWLLAASVELIYQELMSSTGAIWEETELETLMREL